jgi:hypothetical protein
MGNNMTPEVKQEMAFQIFKAKRPALEEHLNRELGKWDVSLNDSHVTKHFFDFLMDNFWVAAINAQEEANGSTGEETK